MVNGNGPGLPLAGCVKSFGASTFADMSSGVRKYGVSLTLAHQYIDQLDSSLCAAVIGTVGTKISFAIGAKDAEALALEVSLKVDDLSRLLPYTAYVDASGPTIALRMPPIAAKRFPSASRRIAERLSGISAYETDLAG